MLKKVAGLAVHQVTNALKVKEIVTVTATAEETWFVEQTIVVILGVAHILTVVSSLKFYFIVYLFISILCFWPKTIKNPCKSNTIKHLFQQCHHFSIFHTSCNEGVKKVLCS